MRDAPWKRTKLSENRKRFSGALTGMLLSNDWLTITLGGGMLPILGGVLVPPLLTWELIPIPSEEGIKG